MNQYELVRAICRRMEAKPYSAKAHDSFDDLERMVPDPKEFYRIMRRIEKAEKRIRERDDSDVIHIG